jgi:Arc/MetJ-type ribon-helix-helix transcriptional regulator
MVGDLPYAQRIAWRRHRLLWVSQEVRLRRAWRTGQREGVCALQALVGPSLERIRPPPYSASSAWTAHGWFQDPYARCARSPGNRNDHGQLRLCRSRAGRPDGAGGVYSNRTDFIRTAIRNQLERHPDLVKDHDDSALDVSASFARPKAPIAQFASTRIRRRGSPRRSRCHA